MTQLPGHTIRWSHGEARVIAAAAMMTDCTFLLPNGPFAPFARAPWMGSFVPGISRHLGVLAGDFVCQPMGRARMMPAPPPGWEGVPMADDEPLPHGPAADRDWTITEASDSAVTLVLDYPESSPVRRLTRRITARDGAPALDTELTVEARRAARVSLGLHPTLRLPEPPARMLLEADFAFGMVHPGLTPPGTAQEFSSLAAVPRPAGPLDLSSVPAVPQQDINVQLCGMRGPVTARFPDEGAALVIDWDRSLLPSLMIWHSDRGIGEPPWNHQFRGIGLEPVAAAFDLGDEVARAGNPIVRRGVATALAIDPEAPVTIRASLLAVAG